MQTGVALNMIAAVFNQGSTLLVNLVVANVLGREVFGRYTMVLATVATLGALGQMSMGYTATKHVAEFRSIDPARTSRILGLCACVAAIAALAVALALAAGGGWLARTVLNAPELGLELRFAAAAVFFTVLNGFLAGALAGLESYPALARAGVITGTVYAVICTSLAMAFGLPGAVGGIALSASVQFGVLAWFLARESARHGVPFTRRGMWQERAIIANFAVPASLSGAMYQPAVWIGTALLARQAAGFHQLALFGAANAFRTMVLFAPQVINNVGMAVLNHQRRSNPRGYRHVFWLNAGMSSLAAVAGAGLLLLAGVSPLRLFGPDFTDGRVVLTIMLGSAVIEAVALAVYQIVVSRGHIWASLAFVAVPRDLSLVLLSLALVPALGATGLATAHASAWFLSFLGVLGLATWKRGASPPAVPVPAP
ncbi:hypothetical protein BH24ACI5_BH24ACI5_07850 [soil metagenome]